MKSNPAKCSTYNKLLLNVVNNTCEEPMNDTRRFPQEEISVLVGKPVSALEPEIVVVGNPVSATKTGIRKPCCYRFRNAEGSIVSKYSYFSISGVFTYMSIAAVTSICSFMCINSAFSVLSVNSVASVASFNSVLSIGSFQCYQCVFNIPIGPIMDGMGRASNTCNKYNLGDGDEANKELLYDLSYHTFKPAIKYESEEDLANDCCLFIHSTEAKQFNPKGFILNANRTECLVYGEGENGQASIDRLDVDTAEYVYKPCPPGEICG